MLGSTPQNSPTNYSAPQLHKFNLQFIPVISRIRRVHYIYHTLLSKGTNLCMLYGPPKCGKTVLIRQLTEQFKLIGNTYEILVGPVDGATEIFDKFNFEQLVTTRSTTPTLIVIDEAQCLYFLRSDQIPPGYIISNDTLSNNGRFWTLMKRFTDSVPGEPDKQFNQNLYIVLIAAYGGAADTHPGTPVDIQCQFDMNHVLMNDDEFHQLTMAYSNVTRAQRITDNLQQIIKSRLGCHIGLTVELLNEYRELGAALGESELIHKLLAGKVSRNLLQYRSIPKSIRNDSMYTNELNALRKVILYGGQCSVNLLNPTVIRQLVTRYYLTIIGGDIRFPSPLLADTVLHMLYAPTKNYAHLNTNTTCSQFIQQAICTMRYRIK